MSEWIRNLDRRLLAVAVVFIVLIAGYAVAISYADSTSLQGAPAGSTFSAGPRGSQILHNYLQGMEVEVRALRDFEELPDDGTIVVIGPEEFVLEPSRGEGRRLLRWVEEGGRVVLAGPNARDVFMGTGIGVSLAPGGDEDTLALAQPGAYADGVAGVEVGAERLLPSETAWVPHLKDEHGHALSSRAMGEGEIVWLASAYPTSNSGLEAADNARLSTLLAAADQPVYFDEYHHGYVKGAGVWTRLGAGGQVAVVLGAIAIVIAILASARRVGPPIAPAESRTVRTGAYIGQLAGLYRKAGARGESLDSLAEGLRTALAQRYGTLDAGLARCDQARTALERAEAARSRGEIQEEEFVSVARDITRARREVEGRDG